MTATHARHADGEHATIVEIRRLVARELATRGQGLSGADYDGLIESLIAQALHEHARTVLAGGDQPLDTAAEHRVAAAVRSRFFGLGGLQQYLDDPTITQININGGTVFVYRDDVKEQVPPIADSNDELIELVRLIAARAGAEERRFDRGVPCLNLELPDGSRLFAAMAVSDEPVVSIRRHPLTSVSLSDLVGYRMLDAGTAALLSAMARARKNVLISGGTNTGKTTLLRAMAREIPPTERLITIEDTRELRLKDPDMHPDCVAFQAREPNIEGRGEIDQADLVRWGLRLRPDRVIVGEVRGPEAISLCNAMSQGNDGSLGTVHASSSAQAFTRLMTYAAQAPTPLEFEPMAMLIAGAVHFVVHLAWSDTNMRVVSSVREVLHAEGRHVISNEVLRPGRDKRATLGAPLRHDTLDDLVAAGFRPELLTSR